MRFSVCLPRRGQKQEYFVIKESVDLFRDHVHVSNDSEGIVGKGKRAFAL